MNAPGTLIPVISSWEIDVDGRVARLGGKARGGVYRRSGAFNGRPALVRGPFQCVGCQASVKDIIRACKLCTPCFRKACRKRARANRASA